MKTILKTGMKFDSVLEQIGGFGKYQVILLSFMNLLAGWQSPVFNTLYTAMNLPYSCNSATKNHSWLQDNNQTQILDPCIREYTLKSSTNTSEPVACTEWIYDHTEYGSSIIEKYNLVCDRASLISLSNSLYLFGMLLGASTIGSLSDRFGRMRMSTVTAMFFITWWYVSAFSPNYVLFAVSRFFTAYAREGFYISLFVYCMEIVGPKWRLLVGIGYHMSYTIGYMLTVGIAYALKDGLMYDLVSLIPLTAVFFILLVIPESPRWLLVTRNYEKAKQTLSQIADINKKDKSVLEDLKSINDIRKVPTKEANLIQMFKSPTMRKRMLILICNWICIDMMYFAVTFNAKDLVPGNYYINHFLLAFMEIPGTVLGGFGCRWPRTGRRLTMAMMIYLPGLLFIIIIPLVLLDVEEVWITILTLLAKGSITGAYSVIFVYAAELLPTEVRTVGIGTCSTLGKLGGVCSTFIGPMLIQVWKPLPYIIFGGLGSVGGALAILLPETLSKPIPETIQDAEEEENMLKSKKEGYIPFN